MINEENCGNVYQAFVIVILGIIGALLLSLVPSPAVTNWWWVAGGYYYGLASYSIWYLACVWDTEEHEPYFQLAPVARLDLFNVSMSLLLPLFLSVCIVALVIAGILSLIFFPIHKLFIPRAVCSK